MCFVDFLAFPVFHRFSDSFSGLQKADAAAEGRPGVPSEGQNTCSLRLVMLEEKIMQVLNRGVQLGKTVLLWPQSCVPVRFCLCALETPVARCNKEWFGSLGFPLHIVFCCDCAPAAMAICSHTAAPNVPDLHPLAMGSPSSWFHLRTAGWTDKMRWRPFFLPFAQFTPALLIWCFVKHYCFHDLLVRGYLRSKKPPQLIGVHFDSMSLATLKTYISILRRSRSATVFTKPETELQNSPQWFSKKKLRLIW